MNLGIKNLGVSCLIAAITLAGCGDDNSEGKADEKTYKLQGTIAELNGQISLSNGKENLSLSSSGNFSFNSEFTKEEAYSVTIKEQPKTQNCKVLNGQGVFEQSSINNVTIACQNKENTSGGSVPAAPKAKLLLKGTVIGLEDGVTVELSDGNENVAVENNGAFSFTSLYASASPYAVTVIDTNNPQVKCDIENHQGTFADSDITNIAVSCKQVVYTLKGNTAGLVGNLAITDGQQLLTIDTEGAFEFQTPYMMGQAYKVGVVTQPTNEVCTVSEGEGNFANADVNTVAINCAAEQFLSVGGSMTGLQGDSTVTISDGKQNLMIDADNTTFTFNTQYRENDTYSISIVTQPQDARCMLANNVGSVASENITNVTLTCEQIQLAFSVTGTIAGLNGTVSVTDGQEIDVFTNTNPTNPVQLDFNTKYKTGERYDIKVAKQPASQNCTVINGKSTIANQDVNNVIVQCQDVQTFKVRARAEGLLPNTQIKITDGKQNLILKDNATAQFTRTYKTNAAYDIKIVNTPANQQCQITNGKGRFTNANALVLVKCTAQKKFTLSGSLSGLATNAVVVNNGMEDVTITANGAYSFATLYGTGDTYAVTVKTNPANQVCNVMNSAGKFAAANINNVNVVCKAVAQTYQLNGTVIGLAAGGTLKAHSGKNAQSIANNGVFTFNTPFSTGEAYNVIIMQQPTNQTCALANAKGVFANTSISNLVITCKDNPAEAYSVSVTVSGLMQGEAFVISNNNDALAINSNGAYVFGDKVMKGQKYNVVVANQPMKQKCEVTQGAGTIANSNVTNILISCKAEGAVQNINFADSALAACFDQHANARGWKVAADADFLACPGKGIKDASGVTQLVNLTSLDLSDNQLTALDLNGLQKLAKLYMKGNSLSQVDFGSNIALVNVDLEANQLIRIDSLGSTHLKTLYVNDNKLTAIDIKHNVNLEELDIASNNIATLDISANTKMKLIDLSNNTSFNQFIAVAGNAAALELIRIFNTAVGTSQQTQATFKMLEDANSSLLILDLP